MRRFLKSRVRLEVEPLEDRLVPVVGATAIPAPVAAGTGFDGVVQFTTDQNTNCTGALLSSGRHILTAAHCITDGNGAIDVNLVNVRFDMPGGPVTFTNITSDGFTIHPSWNGNLLAGNDVAIIALPSIAPGGADRYDPYRGTDEIGQTFTVVGYGRTGTGDNGSNQAGGTKRLGQNRFDMFRGSNQLGFDFDNGLQTNNAIGPLFGRSGLGQGSKEAMMAPGDSGGPSFINGQIAGVSSWLTNQLGSEPTDVDNQINSSFGEIAYSERVSSFASWIDTTIGVPLPSPYDLVLDMNTQAAGNDGRADTIHVRRDGGLVELVVNGQVVHAEVTPFINSITIIGSVDSDTITVDGDLRREVTVDGGGGTNYLTLNGRNVADTITVERKSVVFGSQTINYENVSRLAINAGDGNDVIDVNAVNSDVQLVVRGQGGDSDEMNLNYQSFFGGRQFTVSSSRVGYSSAPVQYSSIEEVELNTGGGNDTFTATNTPYARVTINGLGRLEGPAGLPLPALTNTWNITGVNTGNLNNKVFFSSVLTLVGNVNTDKFVFSNGARLLGYIDGGGGGNTLDYSAYSTPVSVNLANQSGTGVLLGLGGGLRNIQNVIGGLAGDTLVGNDQRNVLSGGPGEDTVRGAGGDDILFGGNGHDSLNGDAGRDILIGGFGADAVDGGAEDDLLIAGGTDFDDSENLFEYYAFQREWTSNRSYEERFENLLNGNGGNFPYALNVDTVFTDASADGLTGGAGRDWFWSDPVYRDQFKIIVDTSDRGECEALRDEPAACVSASITGPTRRPPSARPTFTWTHVWAASRYDLWVNNLTTGQSEIVRRENLTDTSFTPSESLPAGEYKAWVRSFDRDGQPSGWSKSYEFTIVLPAPAAPSVTGPNGSTADATPTITWNAVANAARYELWVNNLTTRKSRVIHQRNLTGTSFTATQALSAGNHRVWVRAFNSAGQSGRWSSAHEFEILSTRPARPSITGPNGGTSDPTPTITWTAVANASRYDLWVNNLTTRRSGVVRQQNLTGNSFTPTQALSPGRYRVWVRASNNAGQSSLWSPAHDFNVFIAIPAAPTLLQPGSITFDRTPTIRWSPVTGATRYELWVNDLTTGQSRVIHSRNVQSTAYTPPSELPVGRYRAWVRAFNSTGQGGRWSAAHDFSIVEISIVGFPVVTL